MTDAERMTELLAYANLSKVAAALEVSRATTAKWAKGQKVTPFRVRQVENLLRPDLAAIPTEAGDVAIELREIRRLLQRRAEPQPAFSLDQLVTAVGSVVEQKLTAGRAGGSPKRVAAGARRRKGAEPVAAKR